MKRLIGVLGTLCVVAVIVWCILGREEFSSAINLEPTAAPPTQCEVQSPETEQSAPEQSDASIAKPDSVVIVK